MTERDRSDHVHNTRWMNEGKVKAICNAVGCGWTKLADQGGAVAAARRHALATRHEVELVRRQARLTIRVEQSQHGDPRLVRPPLAKRL